MCNKCDMLINYHHLFFIFFFFFNDTATTEIYTLSLHDALPISGSASELESAARQALVRGPRLLLAMGGDGTFQALANRSEEHTSELQSQSNLVCRLLLEKKKRRYTSRGNCTSDTCVMQ